MTPVKKTKKATTRSQRYGTDRFASILWRKLLEDFRTFEGPEFASGASEAFEKGLTSYRKYNYPDVGIISPFRFRAWKQLDCLLKKYTFCDDALDPVDREELTIEKYLKTQLRISNGIRRTELVHRVVQRARFLARGILGKFDRDECVTKSHFGKKSSIGCALRDAYIDFKLTNREAFTGSQSVYNWFRDSVLPHSAVLTELVKSGKLVTSLTKETDYLNLMCVPKKWDTDRVITPLPLLDLFYSFGIGEMVSDRLKGAGLDIRRLQTQHRGCVQKYSRTRSHVTADLSSASDSITSELLNMVLPRDWFCALKKIMCRKVCYGASEFYTASILPMGNGATFPLETLVFYVLTKAIGDLARIGGHYSVYGDDLIYPSRLHKFLAMVFPQLNLVLNLDKTFVSYPFRESCGEDYYRGVPVRPFYLQGASEDLTRRKYQCFLYGVYNSLFRRWDVLELPLTHAFLLHELGCLGPLHRVPPSFPDKAGVKVECPVRNAIPWYIPTFPVTILMGSAQTVNKECRDHLGTTRQYHFSFLHTKPSGRVVLDQRPYLYLALQGRDDNVLDYNSSSFWVTDYSTLHNGSRSTGLLQWRTHPYINRYRKNGIVRVERGVRSEAVVSSRIVETITSVPGQTSDWF